MGVAMVEDVIISLKNHHEFVTFGGFNVVFYGLGVVVYAFVGVGMALPLESETQENEKFGKILGLSMGFISLMYATFGVLGYFAFGDATKDIITTNFGKGLVSYVVQLGLCINLFTFPLMMNPVYEVFERRFSNGNYCLWLRWVVVLGVSLVALMVPNFADFLSLVGSCVCGVLADSRFQNHNSVLPSAHSAHLYKQVVSSFMVGMQEMVGQNFLTECDDSEVDNNTYIVTWGQSAEKTH